MQKDNPGMKEDNPCPANIKGNNCLYSMGVFFMMGSQLKLILYINIRIKHPGYRFTKGLTQNLNLRTNLKLEYNIKSLNYIQHNFRFQASFLYYWTISFSFSTWSVV